MINFNKKEELLKNPNRNSVYFYKCGLLDGKNLRKSFKNMMEYKIAFSKNKSQKSNTFSANYDDVVEELFLYGDLGLSTYMKCVGARLKYKLNIGRMTYSDFQTMPAISEKSIEVSSKIDDLYAEFEKKGSDKNKMWIFDAGNSFAGNPKWMFIYVNKYRKDITTCWLINSEEIAEYINSLGYTAFCYGTKEAELVKDIAGVYVVENVKEVMPVGLENVKILNLFHGVGCKRIERNQKNSFFAYRLARKYIQYNEINSTNQLFLATSPFIEKDVSFQCGIDEDKIIRAGYPRVMYQKYCDPVSTYPKDFIKDKLKDKTTKLAVYAPTYRYTGVNYFFSKAFPSLDKLNETLKEKNIVLVMKLHPFMLSDPHYQIALENKDKYDNIIFWDNDYDFYEVMNLVDIAIIDYSSVFTDLVAAGVKHFIRYVFDYEEEKESLDLMYDYYDITKGAICESFDELVNQIKHYEDSISDDELAEIKNLYWEYETENSFEDIIDQTLKFEIIPKQMPTLYSFDIFDTVLARKVTMPEGVFYYVKEKIEKHTELEFSSFFIDNYVKIRKQSEANSRFRNIAKMMEDTDRREILFTDIFDNMKEVYDLNDEQCKSLMNWEIEAEIENAIPIKEQVDYVKDLLAQNNEVVFISDMYLPEEVIRKMLCKIEPLFAGIPIFVSSKYGVQKTTGKLFLEVYNQIEYYNYKKWIHCGDNNHADNIEPKKLGITTKLVSRLEFNDYENKIVGTIKTYDSYLVAGMLARFRNSHSNIKDTFAHNYVSFYFVPYISWALENALKNGYKTLYFVSRDGHHLKRIADEIIREKKYDIKTKYVYFSRKTWRVPSFVDSVHEGFYLKYGSFPGITNIHDFLKAAMLTEDEFIELFPNCASFLQNIDITLTEKNALIALLQKSSEYEKHLLNVAKEMRKNIVPYILQEIDFKESFAFVEYWGRGYTQDCFIRLVESILNRSQEIPFYYIRSIDSTIGTSIKHNFTTNSVSPVFVEALFANIPYASVKDYVRNSENKFEPILKTIPYDEDLFESMQEYLPEFVHNFHQLTLSDRKKIQSEIFDFSLSYFIDNPHDSVFQKCLSPLKDSIALNGNVKQFARELTKADILSLNSGSNVIVNTESRNLSYERSCNQVKNHINKIYQGKEFIYNNSYKLNPTQQQRRRRIKKQFLRYNKRQLNMRTKYDRLVEQYKVKSNRVIIITNNYNADEYFVLKNMLSKNKSINLSIIELSSSSITNSELKKIVRAKCIIVSQFVECINMLTIRPETKVIQMMDIAFPYIKIGCSRWYKILLEQEFVAKKWSNNYSMIPVASKNVIPTISSAYGLDNENICSDIGSCVTDVYFDEEFKNNSMSKFNSFVPKKYKDKKIIMYMPLHRFRNNDCNHLDVMNVNRLLSALGKDYIMLFAPEAISREYLDLSQFSSSNIIDLTSEMTLREQMCISDVIVGDYRHSFFESVLTNKPVYVYNPDNVKRQVYYEYEDVLVGPIVKTEEELATKIIDIDNYDYSYSNEFKAKYLNSCDGDSSKRLFEIIERDTLGKES